MRPVSIGRVVKTDGRPRSLSRIAAASGEPEETYQSNYAISEHGRDSFSKPICASAEIDRAESVAASYTRNQTVGEGCDKAKSDKIGERCVEPENRGEQAPAIRGQHQGRQVDTYRGREVGGLLAREQPENRSSVVTPNEKGYDRNANNRAEREVTIGMTTGRSRDLCTRIPVSGNRFIRFQSHSLSSDGPNPLKHPPTYANEGCKE